MGPAMTPSTTALVSPSMILTRPSSPSPSICRALRSSRSRTSSALLKAPSTMGSASRRFIADSMAGISSDAMIPSAAPALAARPRLFLSTISAIWSRFTSFTPPRVATRSSTVRGLDRSRIMMPPPAAPSPERRRSSAAAMRSRVTM